MSYKIEDIEGIGEAMTKKLAKANIKTTSDLLKMGAKPKGRVQIAEQCKISEKRILKWVNLADLMRVKGVAEQYSELLEAAGVDTVKELRNRKPENLTAAIRSANVKKNLVRSLPGESQVAVWISDAKKLKPMVSY